METNITKTIDASRGTVCIDAELVEQGTVSRMRIRYQYAAGLHQFIVHRGNHLSLHYACYILDPAKDPLRTGSFESELCTQYPEFVPILHRCITDLHAEMVRCKNARHGED